MDRIYACRQGTAGQKKNRKKGLDRINRMDRIFASPPEAGQAISHRLRRGRQFGGERRRNPQSKMKTFPDLRKACLSSQKFQDEIPPVDDREPVGGFSSLLIDSQNIGRDLRVVLHETPESGQGFH